MKGVLFVNSLRGLLLLILTAAFMAAPAMAALSPQDQVAETTARIIKALKSEQQAVKADPVRLYDIVDKIVLPHFDFQRMSSWVLGKYWRTATPAQRKQFAQEFRSLLVRTYAAALNDNYDRQIKMLPLRAKKNATEVTIRTEVQQNAGFPIPINYKMYQTANGDWRVFDVSVDGVSLVTNYRSAFGTVIRREGLPRLIANLSKRNKQAMHD